MSVAASGDGASASASASAWKNCKGGVIGLDLGTTRSCVGGASMADNEPAAHILDLEGGLTTTPTCIGFMPDNTMLFGNQAKEETLLECPQNLIYNVKRIIGRKYSDNAVQEDIRAGTISFTLRADDNDDILIKVMEENGEPVWMSPIVYTSIFIRHLVEWATQKLGTKVTHAVITVPANFKDAQRTATLQAAYLSGFEENHVRLLQEPTAAAYAFGLDKNGTSTNVVYDLGGGTFDVSVVFSDNGDCTVKATKGDMNLGGDNFTQDIVDWCLSEIRVQASAQVAESVRSNAESMAMLREASNKAKHTLSDSTTATIQVRALWEDADGKAVNFKFNISRADFEDRNKLLFDECRETVTAALKDAGLNKGDIDHVILVGGSTRIWGIRQLLSDYFGKPPNRQVHPDEAVAMGAATYALSLASSQLSTPSLKDVIPLSLGIALSDGSMSFIIERNTQYPISVRHPVTNSEANQKAVRIDVYEGERSWAEQNTLLDSFILHITPLPLATAKLMVTFTVNEHGILIASAEELFSNNKTELRVIKRTNSISPERLQLMLEQVRCSSINVSCVCILL
ncbi:heat shock protein 70 family [Tribonema minus]|uniref:Heat shock protein 70 family n=1 Tax=Tribonema minus TaxID=303371 RepID=A0A835YYZ6_9STRA|nr:heat shock protein 70 family [Tribonema minus]